MKDYLRCIRSVDDGVGRILAYLDRTGLASNTIVVYTSDQGFYLGEHGWFDKRWIFKQSLRTPLLVRWPGVVKPNTRNRRDIVSNLDFAETFCEVAGVPVPAEMQGRSLVPVLQGHTPGDWRKDFYYHYYEWPAVHNVRPHYGVVSDRYKLVKFYGDVDYWELFDLEKDPEELTSVYDDPAYAATRTATAHRIGSPAGETGRYRPRSAAQGASPAGGSEKPSASAGPAGMRVRQRQGRRSAAYDQSVPQAVHGGGHLQARRGRRRADCRRRRVGRIQPVSEGWQASLRRPLGQSAVSSRGSECPEAQPAGDMSSACCHRTPSCGCSSTGNSQVRPTACRSHENRSTACRSGRTAVHRLVSTTRD